MLQATHKWLTGFTIIALFPHLDFWWNIFAPIFQEEVNDYASVSQEKGEMITISITDILLVAVI